ncbi:MAG: FecR domain-containing protein [Cyanobacteria bacterium]|nr:FecR domain-containing protein [Cyanobacteriota bacterium]
MGIRRRVWLRQWGKAIVVVGAAALTPLGRSLRSPAQSVYSRYLEVTRLSGSVTYQGARSARVGDRLTSSGHSLTTSSRSSASLTVDFGIGTITMAENTRLVVARLDILQDGAYVTVIRVDRGQARMQTRPFTNVNSRLELHTPTGVASVRGTDFGVNVSQAQGTIGKTGVGTLSGRVGTIAQGETVEVIDGQATLVLPGAAPEPPIALDRELALNLTEISRRGRNIILRGRTNPTNTLLVNGEEIPLTPIGGFDTQYVLAHRDNSITVQLRNPIGEVRDYPFPGWRLDNLDQG